MLSIIPSPITDFRSFEFVYIFIICIATIFSSIQFRQLIKSKLFSINITFINKYFE